MVKQSQSFPNSNPVLGCPLNHLVSWCSYCDDYLSCLSFSNSTKSQLMNSQLSSLSCQLMNLLAEQTHLPGKFAHWVPDPNGPFFSSTKCHSSWPRPWQLSGKLATKRLRWLLHPLGEQELLCFVQTEWVQKSQTKVWAFLIMLPLPNHCYLTLQVSTLPNPGCFGEPLKWYLTRISNVKTSSLCPRSFAQSF